MHHLSLIPLENIDLYHVRHFDLSSIASKIQAYLHLSGQVDYAITAVCQIESMPNF